MNSKKDMANFKILIYGAGVIGCLYASLLSGGGCDVTVYARGKRLVSLRKNGLMYQTPKGIKRAKVRVISELAASDCYDFIFLTVRENQLHEALSELRENASGTIVTMVNSIEPYEIWEQLCGKGRILPAFPGAGGGFRGEILEASLTPKLIQPTTFGEISGAKTERVKTLARLLRKAGIPYQIVTDMHAWQISHLAMVVPLADAYYETDDPQHAGDNQILMRNTAEKIQENYRKLKRMGVSITPAKMNLFRILPKSLLAKCLAITYNSQFGNTFMYQHAIKAPDEMQELHRAFYDYLAHSKKTM